MITGNIGFLFLAVKIGSGIVVMSRTRMTLWLILKVSHLHMYLFSYHCIFRAVVKLSYLCTLVLHTCCKLVTLWVNPLSSRQQASRENQAYSNVTGVTVTTPNDSPVFCFIS